MKPVTNPDELMIENPLVEALIRTHRHPAMPREMPSAQALIVF